MAEFEKTYEQSALRESPQEEATFGFLLRKPALKSVSKILGCVTKTYSRMVWRRQSLKTHQSMFARRRCFAFLRPHREFILWFPCVSHEWKRQEVIPRILLLQFRKMNGNPKEHIKNIWNTRSSKRFSLTFPPSQLCDVPDHVTQIEAFHWKWHRTSFLGRKTFEISGIEQNL